MARLSAVRDRPVRPVTLREAVAKGRLTRGAPRAACERGSASPVVVAVIAVVVVLAAALADVGAGLVAGARANGAADLSALAAAREDRDLRAQGAGASLSLERACRVAEELAGRNGASLTRCERGAGWSIVVFMKVPTPGWPGSVTARSRAGPSWG